MSFGRKSALYKPVSAEMLPALGEHFIRIGNTRLQKLFGIMTDKLCTETLLFVSVADMLERFLANERDAASFSFGAGIRLSAIANDQSHKAQSAEMELLHDVLVELAMAGSNFAQLQKFLRSEFGAALVQYHSCGSAIVAEQDVEAFYEKCADEQLLRTSLDWSAETRKNVPAKVLLAEYQYLAQDAEAVKNCFAISTMAVGLLAAAQKGVKSPVSLLPILATA